MEKLVNKEKMTIQAAISKMDEMGKKAFRADETDHYVEAAVADIGLSELADEGHTDVIMVSGGKLDDLKCEVVGERVVDESEDVHCDGEYIYVIIIDGTIHVLVDDTLESKYFV